MALEPEPYEIAGFEIFARKQTDGKFMLGSGKNGRIVDAFPEKFYVCGAIYTLEYIKWNTDGCTKEQLHTWSEEAKSICWGVYV
jgi:hypothetical protein